MKCRNCHEVIKGTEKYNPKNDSRDRVYWNEFVEIQIHEKLHYTKYTKNEVMRHYSKIKKFFDNHAGMHGMTGEQYQNSIYYNRFNASWRGFGAMMAAYMNTKLGKRKYCYIHFYM